MTLDEDAWVTGDLCDNRPKGAVFWGGFLCVQQIMGVSYKFMCYRPPFLRA